MQCSKNAQNSIDSKYIIFQKNDENFAYSMNTITSTIFIIFFIFLFLCLKYGIFWIMLKVQRTQYFRECWEFWAFNEHYHLKNLQNLYIQST